MSRPAGATAGRLYALLAGAGLTLGGIAGFLYGASFGTGSEVDAGEILGTFATNGWLNLLHLAAGIAGLGLASRAPAAYALAAGALFTVAAAWGLAAAGPEGGSILELLPVNGPLSLTHLGLGVAGLLAGWSSRTGAPSGARQRSLPRSPSASPRSRS